MDIQIVQGSIAEQAVDCLVVNLFAGTTTLSGATASVDRSLDGAISQLLSGGDFSGDAGTTALLYTNGNLPAPRVLVVGLGNSDEFTIHGARLAAATAAKAAAQLKGVKSIASVIHSGGPHDMNTARITQALVGGTRLAIYRAPQYKREAPEPGLTALTIVEFDTEKLDSIQEGVRAGRILADAVCLARDLSSEPANVLYPETMAERAREMAQEAGLRCTVLDEAAMRAEGM